MSGEPGILSSRRRGGSLPGMAPAAVAAADEVAARVATNGGDDPKGAAAQTPAAAAEAAAQKAAAAKRNASKRAAKPGAAKQPGAAGRPPDTEPETRTPWSAALRFGGTQKVTVTTRTYPPVWNAYADAAVALTRENRGRVYQADLINAVLATRMPASAEQAREILAEYRALLEADPPRDLRS